MPLSVFFSVEQTKNNKENPIRHFSCKKIHQPGIQFVVAFASWLVTRGFMYSSKLHTWLKNCKYLKRFFCLVFSYD